MNFYKAYKEKIEKEPINDDDYVYYLYERFLAEYIPNVLEEAVNKRSNQVKFAFSHVEKYLSDIIANDVTKGIERGTIKDVQNVNIYINKFSKYIPKVLELIQNMPFFKNDGFIEANICELLSYYYLQYQHDILVLPKTDKDNILISQTKKLFINEIVLKLIPNVIQLCKDKNIESMDLIYSIEKGVAEFGNVKFESVNLYKNGKLIPNGVDLYELGRLIAQIPCEDVTDYASREKSKIAVNKKEQIISDEEVDTIKVETKPEPIENKYTFRYSIQSLEAYYNGMMEALAQSKNKGRKRTRKTN